MKKFGAEKQVRVGFNYFNIINYAANSNSNAIFMRLISHQRQCLECKELKMYCPVKRDEKEYVPFSLSIVLVGF